VIETSIYIDLNGERRFTLDGKDGYLHAWNFGHQEFSFPKILQGLGHHHIVIGLVKDSKQVYWISDVELINDEN